MAKPIGMPVSRLRLKAATGEGAQKEHRNPTVLVVEARVGRNPALCGRKEM